MLVFDNRLSERLLQRKRALASAHRRPPASAETHVCYSALTRHAPRWLAVGAAIAIAVFVTSGARAESVAHGPRLMPRFSDHTVPAYVQTSGAVLFAAGYGLAFATATIVVSGPLGTPGLQHGSADYCMGDVCDSSPWLVTRHWWPLYVPIAGPLWSLGYADIRRDAGARFYLYTSFALQTAGAGLWLAGMLAQPLGGSASSAPRQIAVVPLFAPNARGFSAVGMF